MRTDLLPWQFSEIPAFDEVMDYFGKVPARSEELPDKTEIVFNSYPLEHAENIHQYIYFLLDNKNIVYIGQTNGPYRRIKQHKSSKHFTHFSLISCTSYLDMNDFESELIVKYSPRYNRNLPSNTRYKKIKQIKEDCCYRISMTDVWDAINKYSIEPSWKQYYDIVLIESCLRQENDNTPPQEIKKYIEKEQNKKRLNLVPGG